MAKGKAFYNQIKDRYEDLDPQTIEDVYTIAVNEQDFNTIQEINCYSYNNGFSLEKDERFDGYKIRYK